jgi:seryl-tRNA synthetase
MLDIRIIRENPQAIAERLKIKRFNFDVEGFLSLDQARKEADTQSQNLLAERKLASKKVGELIKSGLSVENAKQSVKATLEKIEEQLDSLKTKAQLAGDALNVLMMSIPNIPDQEVPEGDDEESNVEILKWGEVRTFDFTAKDHVDVGDIVGGLDFELAAKLTGSRFVVMQGNMARLHRALIQLMLDTHINEHAYQEIYVPYMVNAESLKGTGQLPKFEEDLFKIEGEQNFYLIPTAEVPVTNIVRDRILEPDELGEGLRYVCHSPCFRSEAGSYGRDTRGMIRQHQFEKIEMVKVVRAEQSADALETLTENAEGILRKLNLPYRKVILCGGDLGFGAKKTYDLEVWLPGQQKYREISSCSNFGDFQARRMMARCRNVESGKPEYLHTVNGSGLAVGRTLVAILENYQTEDGNVTVPEALVPYMGGLTMLG